MDDRGPDAGDPDPGEAEREFRPGRRKAVLLLVLAVVLMIVGVGATLILVDAAEHDQKVSFRGLRYFPVVAPLLIIFAAFFWANRLIISPTRIVAAGLFVRRECHRDAVTRIVWRPVKKGSSQYICDFVRRDGAQFWLGELNGTTNAEVLQALREWAGANGIPWEDDPAGPG